MPDPDVLLLKEPPKPTRTLELTHNTLEALRAIGSFADGCWEEVTADLNDSEKQVLSELLYGGD